MIRRHRTGLITLFTTPGSAHRGHRGETDTVTMWERS